VDLLKWRSNSCSEFSLTMRLPSTALMMLVCIDLELGLISSMHNHYMNYKPSLLIGFTMTILTLPLWVFGSFSILTSTVIASNTLTLTLFPSEVGIVIE